MDIENAKDKEQKAICSEVLPYLYISGESAANSDSILSRNGVTHVVNLFDERNKPVAPSVERKYLVVPIHGNSGSIAACSASQS